MNKKIFLMILISFLLITFFVFAASPTQPGIFYPDSAGIVINTGTEINWTNSSDTDEDIIRYNLFYSNDSGVNWQGIIYDWGYENKLNDSGTSKNLSFSGNENQTVYIDIPKVANITSAKLNLTGYQNTTGLYTLLYSSLIDESESDGGRDGSASSLAFGRVGSYNPIDIYLLVYTPPDGNISRLELRLGPAGSNPETKDFVYNVYIAETDNYLIEDPTDDNTTSYTKVKNEINVSAEWGEAQNVYKNITFDDSYIMDSSKKYIMWFEFVSGQEGVNSGYSIMFDDDVTNNYSATSAGTTKTSYKRLFESNLYTATEQIASDVWLEVGNPDRNYEFQAISNFTTTNTTNDFKSSMQNYIDNFCAAELWENCSIPLLLHSNTSGKIEISDISIKYTDYWWNTTDMRELTTYRINITPTNRNSNGSSAASGNDFTISHNNPNVTLNSPNASFSSAVSDPFEVTFNCSATDDTNLANVSLYITDSNNQSFSLNQAKSFFGVDGEANWTLSLSNGHYTWNCLAYDGVGNKDWAENRSIIINYAAPPASTSPSTGGSITSSVLLDVKILKIDSPAKPGEFLNFTYLVKAVGSINDDIVIGFFLSRNEQTLFEGYDTIYFSINEEKTETTELFLPSTLEKGVYDFYVEASYKNYKANAKRIVEVIEEEKESEIKETEFFPDSSGKENFFRKISEFFRRNRIYFLIGFGSLIFFLLVILLISKIKHSKKRDFNRLKSARGLKVFCEDGIDLGKVKDVYIQGNKIQEWIITPNRDIRKKIRKKKILLKHKHVKSIKKIMIVDRNVSRFLKIEHKEMS